MFAEEFPEGNPEDILNELLKKVAENHESREKYLAYSNSVENSIKFIQRQEQKVLTIVRNQYFVVKK